MIFLLCVCVCVCGGGGGGGEGGGGGGGGCVGGGGGGQRVEGATFPLSPVKNISGRVLLLRCCFPFKIRSSLRNKRFRARSSNIRPITQARLADT